MRIYSVSEVVVKTAGTVQSILQKGTSLNLSKINTGIRTLLTRSSLNNENFAKLTSLISPEKPSIDFKKVPS